MTNYDLVQGFLDGATEGKASNLYIDGYKLINYETVIALRTVDYIALNSDYYSRTTSVHQNRIRRSGEEYIEVTEDEITDIQLGHFVDKPLMKNEKEV